MTSSFSLTAASSRRNSFIICTERYLPTHDSIPTTGVSIDASKYVEKRGIDPDSLRLFATDSSMDADAAVDAVV